MLLIRIYKRGHAYVRQCKLEERLPSNREMFIFQYTMSKRCMTLCTQDQCAQKGDVASSCCQHKLKCPSGTDRNSQDLRRTQVSPVSGRLSCIHSFIPWILAQASFSEFFLPVSSASEAFDSCVCSWSTVSQRKKKPGTHTR